MRTTDAKCFFLLLLCWAVCTCQAEAHVKWFLTRPESEILAEAKPALFTQLSVWNLAPILIAVAFIFACFILSKYFAHNPLHFHLVDFGAKHEAIVNLFMAISLGASLIYCSISKLLLVPDFIICSHCPWYLPHLEFLTGVGLILGLFSRAFALALFGLLFFALSKHGVSECLELMPYSGLATYFLLMGRDKFSLDYVFNIDRNFRSSTCELSHLIVRTSMALGLIALAFDEKLMHPQLALELLKCEPQLNFAHGWGFSNEMFTLCGGLGELVLGLMLLLGIFPRLVMIALSLLFAVTTVIFGYREFYGHALFYGIIFSTFLRGVGTLNRVTTLWYFSKAQNGGFRLPLLPTKNCEERLESTAPTRGTLKYLLPIRKTHSSLAKEKQFILSGKLLETMQLEAMQKDPRSEVASYFTSVMT